MTREVHGVTGKHKNNVELHVAGGWCGCCFQGGIGTRAVNKSLLFKHSWGLLGPSRGLLRPYLAFTKPEKAQESPRRLGEGPRGIVKLSKDSLKLKALVLSHPQQQQLSGCLRTLFSLHNPKETFSFASYLDLKLLENLLTSLSDLQNP